MKRKYFLPIFALVMVFTNANISFSKSVLQENRFALVIGNGGYKSSPLRNPANDARDMAARLRKLGFEVMHRENASQRSMEAAIRRFGRSLRKGGVGLFYFAGHGVQVNGRNYLIPIGADIEKETEVKYEAVDAGRVLDEMYEAGNGLNIVVLDACRDNPFARSFRTRTGGLARMDAPTGTFIAYSTAPGSIAADGEGRNGIFTHHLLKNIPKPGLKIEDILKEVRKGVISETNNKQVPWQSSSLTGDFYFVASSGAVIEKPTKQINDATLSIESNVLNAAVFVDGRGVGKTPLSDKQVSPGEHSIRVEKDGYEPYSRRVRFEKGRSVSLYVDLSEKEMRKGRLFVNTEPKEAQIRILNISPKFYQGIELDPGRYHLEVSDKGYEKKELWISFEAGEDKHIDMRLDSIAVSSKMSNSLGMEFVYLKPGTFMMGSPSNEPGRYKNEIRHRVTLTRGFHIQTTEVTQGQWKAVMGNNPSYFKNCGDRCPVEKVSWDDVQEFIAKLNRRGGERYRLPTEAEWEYACRAGTTTSRYWGDNPDDACRYANVHDQTSKRVNKFSWQHHNCDDGFAKTAPVGRFKTNGFGLHDMLGNVWEWCQDWYGDYTSGSVSDPAGPDGGSDRVLRGGSWNYKPRGVRCANRGDYAPGYRGDAVGFRLVRTD